MAGSFRRRRSTRRRALPLWPEAHLPAFGARALAASHEPGGCVDPRLALRVDRAGAGPPGDDELLGRVRRRQVDARTPGHDVVKIRSWAVGPACRRGTVNVAGAQEMRD